MPADVTASPATEPDWWHHRFHSSNSPTGESLRRPCPLAADRCVHSADGAASINEVSWGPPARKPIESDAREHFLLPVACRHLRWLFRCRDWHSYAQLA